MSGACTALRVREIKFRLEWMGSDGKRKRGKKKNKVQCPTVVSWQSTPGVGQWDVLNPHDWSSAMPLVSFCWTTHAHCVLMVIVIYCTACVKQTLWLHDSSLVALPSILSSQCQGAKQDHPLISWMDTSKWHTHPAIQPTTHWHCWEGDCSIALKHKQAKHVFQFHMPILSSSFTLIQHYWWHHVAIFTF